jgi:DNA-binding XRE family transcriptional regulator
MRDLVRSGEARELRISNGLSLAEVAKDIGVDRTTVYHWEQGVCLPRGPHALRYARLLEALKRVAS